MVCMINSDPEFRDNPPNPEGLKRGKANPAYDTQKHIHDMHQPEVHTILRQWRR